jgi:hypothetical protein
MLVQFLFELEASKNNPNWGLLWVDTPPVPRTHPGHYPSSVRNISIYRGVFRLMGEFRGL